MRFTCEKCGRSYTADERLRGRGFRMKCRQCGNFILVPGGQPTPAPGHQTSSHEIKADSSTGVNEESDTFAALAEELAQVPDGQPSLPDPLGPPPDPFLNVRPAPGPRPGAAPAAPASPASETDEVFADLARQIDTSTGSHPLDVKGGGLISPPPPAAAPAPAERRAVPPAAARRGSRKWIAAGLGLGVGIAVAAVVATSMGKRPATTPAAAAPLAPAAAAPAPAPVPVPAATARTPEPRPVAPAEAAPVAAPPASPAPEPERPARAAAPPAKPKPAPRPPAKAPAKPTRVAAAKAEPPARPAAASVQAAAASAAPAPNDGPLLEEQIQATIARYAGAFEGCAAQAHRQEPQLVAEQRKVTITMTVTPAGKVLYPTLDDQELSNSGLGACLKREAAKMAFPEFGGEPVRVRMPLVVK